MRHLSNDGSHSNGGVLSAGFQNDRCVRNRAVGSSAIVSLALFVRRVGNKGHYTFDDGLNLTRVVQCRLSIFPPMKHPMLPVAARNHISSGRIQHAKVFPRRQVKECRLSVLFVLVYLLFNFSLSSLKFRAVRDNTPSVTLKQDPKEFAPDFRLPWFTAATQPTLYIGAPYSCGTLLQSPDLLNAVSMVASAAMSINIASSR
jgi:hypothetical protein